MTGNNQLPLNEAVTALTLEVFRFNGQLLAVGDELGRDLGLSSARWQVLSAVVDTPLSVAHVAFNRGLTRQSVQRVANLLAEEKLIIFTENPRHRRAKLVTLTELGRASLSAVIARHTDWVNKVVAGIDSNIIAAAAATITMLRQRIETEESK